MDGIILASCLQKVSGGSKSGQLAGTVTSCTIADDVKYNIKIEVKDRNVKCYLDGLLYVDYTIPETEGSESYWSCKYGTKQEMSL